MGKHLSDDFDAPTELGCTMDPPSLKDPSARRGRRSAWCSSLGERGEGTTMGLLGEFEGDSGALSADDSSDSGALSDQACDESSYTMEVSWGILNESEQEKEQRDSSRDSGTKSAGNSSEHCCLPICNARTRAIHQSSHEVANGGSALLANIS